MQRILKSENLGCLGIEKLRQKGKTIGSDTPSPMGRRISGIFYFVVRRHILSLVLLLDPRRNRGDQVSKERRKLMEMEVEVFLTVDHPQICRLYDVYESTTGIQLVMECLAGGELTDRVNDRGIFGELDASESKIPNIKL